jgi:signal transduction histidine kinase
MLADLSADAAVILAVQPDVPPQMGLTPNAKIEHLSSLIPPVMLKALIDGRINVASHMDEREATAPIEKMLLVEGIHSYANIPLRVQGELVGLLNLGFILPQSFSQEHLEAGQAVADQLAIAIQQARLHEQIRQHAADLELRVAERTRELEVANENLRALSLVKDEFVSNVSHELRTPITSLRLYHELLLKRPERHDEYIQALQRETERLNTLVEDILTLSRMDQERAHLIYDTVDINALIREYVQDRSLLARNKGLSLIYEGDANQVNAVADRNLLGQAISILLTNALNYTPSGGEVTVQTRLTTSDGKSWVGIAVRDTGPGIPAKEQQRLFTRFYRGRVGRTSGIPGTGLGLAIAYEIVERHMGRVEVNSTGVDGEGAEFVIWLPLQDTLTA